MDAISSWAHQARVLRRTDVTNRNRSGKFRRSSPTPTAANSRASALIFAQSASTVRQYLLTRFARLGPLCDSPRAQKLRLEPHNGPREGELCAPGFLRS